MFAILVDVVMKSARYGLLEILYADELALMSQTLEELRDKLWKWKEVFESKGFKVNLGKTKMMVSGAQDESVGSKVDHVVYVGREPHFDFGDSIGRFR